MVKPVDSAIEPVDTAIDPVLKPHHEPPIEYGKGDSHADDGQYFLTHGHSYYVTLSHHGPKSSCRGPGNVERNVSGQEGEDTLRRVLMRYRLSVLRLGNTLTKQRRGFVVGKAR